MAYSPHSLGSNSTSPLPYMSPLPGVKHEPNTGMPTLGPRLVILEQPQERFRFRYESELGGTHGQLAGRSGADRRSFPTVKLEGFHRPATIRCELYTVEEGHVRSVPHVHSLQGRNCSRGMAEMRVDLENDFTASFQGLGIIHTAKKQMVDKITQRKLEEMQMREELSNPGHLWKPTERDQMEAREKASRESQRMNMNRVCLRFSAFIRNANIPQDICPPVFSDPIYNGKSAQTGELKIVQLSEAYSSCTGNKEIWLLVERVRKNDIRVRVYEEDESGQEIWSDYGRVIKCHHQYAIIFQTPPYRDKDLKSTVRVFIQLERPSDGCVSEPKSFQYTERDHRTTKRTASSMFDQPECSRMRMGEPGEKRTRLMPREGLGVASVCHALPDTIARPHSATPSVLTADTPRPPSPATHAYGSTDVIRYAESSDSISVSRDAGRLVESYHSEDDAMDLSMGRVSVTAAPSGHVTRWYPVSGHSCVGDRPPPPLPPPAPPAPEPYRFPYDASYIPTVVISREESANPAECYPAGGRYSQSISPHRSQPSPVQTGRPSPAPIRQPAEIPTRPHAEVGRISVRRELATMHAATSSQRRSPSQPPPVHKPRSAPPDLIRIVPAPVPDPDPSGYKSRGADPCCGVLPSELHRLRPADPPARYNGAREHARYRVTAPARAHGVLPRPVTLPTARNQPPAAHAASLPPTQPEDLSVQRSRGGPESDQEEILVVDTEPAVSVAQRLVPSPTVPVVDPTPVSRVSGGPRPGVASPHETSSPRLVDPSQPCCAAAAPTPEGTAPDHRAGSGSTAPDTDATPRPTSDVVRAPSDPPLTPIDPGNMSGTTGAPVVPVSEPEVGPVSPVPAPASPAATRDQSQDDVESALVIDTEEAARGSHQVVNYVDTCSGPVRIAFSLGKLVSGGGGAERRGDGVASP